MRYNNYDIKGIFKNKPAILAVVTFLITLSVSSNIFIMYNEIEYAKEIKDTRVSNLMRYEWRFIESIITENIDKSRINGEKMAEELRSEIKQDYKNDYSRLLYDMTHVKQKSPFIDSISEVIDGEYINVDNDNNDPFIAIHKVTSYTDSTKIPIEGELSAILGDKSLNCSSDDVEIRNWQKEISLHSNKELARRAIYGLLNQSDDLLYWQFLPDASDIVITDMSMKSLEKKFYKEGVTGLKPYEFLVPTYVESSNDILGNPYVGSLGKRGESYMIIINQGFSIYDQLVKTHLITLSEYETEKQRIVKEYKQYESNKILIIILETIMMIIMFISIATIQRQLTTDDVASIISIRDGEEYDDNGDRN